MKTKRDKFQVTENCTETCTETCKVLIVEDEALIAMNLRMELKRMGCGVLKPVPTGEAAIRVVEGEDKPDLILMDIRLAGRIDGLEAAREIQRLADIPIIMITGYENRGFIEKASGLKSLAYLIKPVEMDELKRTIRAIISKEKCK